MTDMGGPPADGADETPEVEVASTSAAAPGAFAFFALEGARFDEAPGLPAENAREVGAYRDALAAIARELWRREHPEAGRLPNNFLSALDLRLTTVERGSVRPTLVLNRPSRGVTDEEWAEWRPYFERARDLATIDVNVVDAESAVPPDMSRSVRKALRGIGSTLDGDERIKLGAPGRDAPRATVTHRVRDILKQIDAVLPPEPREAAAVGVVTEYNGATLSFELKTGTAVLSCYLDAYDEDLATQVTDVLARDGVTAPDVRVEGQTVDPDSKIRRIYQVHTIQTVWTIAEKVIVSRLRALVGLGPNWLGPGSDAPTSELAALLEPLIPTIAALGHPVGIVANADGALVLEWRIGDVEYTAEVAPDRSLFMCADNVVTDALASAEVPFDVQALERFLTTGNFA